MSSIADACLRELAQGPLVSFPNGRWGRRRDTALFPATTVYALCRGGYATCDRQRAKLTPAGLDAARARGFLPALAKVTKGDSHLPTGGEP